MANFFTLVGLVFACSMNSNNDLYPSYLYSVHLNSGGFVPSYSINAYLNNSVNVTSLKTTLSFNIDGDLYFNDDGEYYIKGLTGTCDYNFYNYDIDAEEYYLFDSLSFDLFTIDYYSSSGLPLMIPDSYSFSNPQSSMGQFGITCYTYNTLGTVINTETKLLNVSGTTLVPNQDEVSFRFNDSNVSNDIYNLVTNFIANGYNLGFDTGYNTGYDTGYGDGYNTAYADGASTGYNNGYAAGYNEGATQDATAVAIFSGIISVGLIPINFFLACLNFEVFGINIGAFVSALLTVAIVVIITRMIVSGGNGGDK